MAVGALLAVFHGLVFPFAAVAPGHGGDRLQYQLAVFQHLVAAFEVIPRVGEQVGHDAGDLAHLQHHLADGGEFVFLRRLIQRFGEVQNDTHFVHGLFPASEGGFDDVLDGVGPDLFQLVLALDHVAGVGQVAAQVDGVELAAGGAKAAAHAAVQVHGGGAAAEAPGGFDLYLLLGEGQPQVVEGGGRLALLRRICPAR